MNGRTPKRTPSPGQIGARRSAHRRGSVLLVVLVIIALLTLAIYSFADLSVAEVEATTMFGRSSQTRAYADSGIELATALITDPLERSAEDYYHRPEIFAGLLLQDSLSPRGRGRISVIAPNESDPMSRGVRYGLSDESGKLNLNAAVKWNLNEQQKRTLLMRLPEMTVEIADAVLDWIDEDALSRQYGAESDFYESLAEPYAAVNGPLSSLDELLLVREVTPELLYGEDANRNGLLDDAEDLNGDGALQPGWSAYLTVYSRESNVRSDGAARIHLNQDQLAPLYDALAKEFDEEIARFVTAYRLNGVLTTTTVLGGAKVYDVSDLTLNNGGSNSSQNSSNGGAKLAQPSGNATGGGSSGSGNSGGEKSASKGGSGQAAPTGGEKRGGLDLSGQPKAKINSLYDLVDARVQTKVNSQNTTLESPWKSDDKEFPSKFTPLFNVLSTTEAKTIDGRVNINQAREEVLLGLPGVSEQLAHAIYSNRNVGPNGEPITDVLNTHATSAWLLLEGLADVATMRQIDPYITTRGDVYRIQSIGFFDAGGPATRLEAVLDATEQPPKTVFFRDLSELGAGYSRAQLTGQ